jgi:hypothetical protein
MKGMTRQNTPKKPRRFILAWKGAWQLWAFRNQFLWSIGALLVTLVLHYLLLMLLEKRQGPVLNDPILQIFPPYDLHWIVYALTYSGILLGFTALFPQPFTVLLTFRSGVVLLALRVIGIALLPLDPPRGVIPLVDPLSTLWLHSPPPTHDLLFPWQVAVLALLAITVTARDLRIVFTVFAALVSILFLFQHSQYSLGLFLAPCFAFVAFGIARVFTVRGIPQKGKDPN